MESLEDQLIDQLEQKFGQRPGPKDSLASIGVDSIGMAEMTLDLEKNFGIRVDDDIVEVDSVEDLARYVRERQNTSTS